jgi:hypothetical protein
MGCNFPFKHEKGEKMQRRTRSYFYTNSKVMGKILFGFIVMTFIPAELAYAENWQDFSGASTLREFVSGASAEIELKKGVMATGRYNEDGTAEIEAWGEIFPRTWEVRGDNLVCYSSETETNCYSFEQNLDIPRKYRARHVETGELTLFRISETEPRIISRDTPPDNEGGLVTPSAQDIANELSNPNTALGTMNLQFDYIAFDGDLPDADNQEAYRFQFQPSMPYPISDTTNLFFRPAIPLILDQDVPSSQGGFVSKGVDLGDISFDAALGRSFPNGIVLIVGLVATLPTATDDALGLDQWLLGPEAAIAVLRSWGVVGMLLTHQWDVAGEDDYNTSITGGQYFYAINLSDGWQINGSPTFSYNHEADSDNAWTFPLAVGVAKTTIINGRPWKFGLQYWHYVKSPDVFGPDFQIRFAVSPVVKLPW